MHGYVCVCVEEEEQVFRVSAPPSRALFHIENSTFYNPLPAGPRSAIGRAPDSLVRGPGFDTRSDNILSFLLPLFQEGQLLVTGTKYWSTA